MPSTDSPLFLPTGAPCWDCSALTPLTQRMSDILLRLRSVTASPARTQPDTRHAHEERFASRQGQASDNTGSVVVEIMDRAFSRHLGGGQRSSGKEGVWEAWKSSQLIQNHWQQRNQWNSSCFFKHLLAAPSTILISLHRYFVNS